MSAIKVIGLVLLAVILILVGIYYVTAAKQEQELRNAEFEEHRQMERRAGEEQLYASELRLIRLKIGPVAEATWRAKENDVVNCIMTGEHDERCKKLMWDWRMLIKQISK